MNERNIPQYLPKTCRVHFLPPRDSPDPGDQAEEAVEGADSPGERWRPPRLQDEGRLDGDAPGRGAPKPRGHEDAAGAGGVPELQGRKGSDAALPDHHAQRGAPVHGDAVARPRDHRGAGPAGVAGGTSGELSKFGLVIYVMQ